MLERRLLLLLPATSLRLSRDYCGGGRVAPERGLWSARLRNVLSFPTSNGAGSKVTNVKRRGPATIALSVAILCRGAMGVRPEAEVEVEVAETDLALRRAAGSFPGR